MRATTPSRTCSPGLGLRRLVSTRTADFRPLAMPLEPGTSLGSYQVTANIGGGGAGVRGACPDQCSAALGGAGNRRKAGPSAGAISAGTVFRRPGIWNRRNLFGFQTLRGTSAHRNRCGVPNGNRTYVDAQTPRKSTDFGLKLTGSVTRVRGVPLASAALGFGSLTCVQLIRDSVAASDRSVQNITR